MGLMESFARGYASGRARGRLLERFCREIGWGVDERDGDTIAFFFKGDDITARRIVYATHAEGGKVVDFVCHHRGTYSAEHPPEDMLGKLLLTNARVGVGAWSATVRDDTIHLSVRYTAFVAGMDAATFRAICVEVLKEVTGMEMVFREEGLL